MEFFLGIVIGILLSCLPLIYLYRRMFLAENQVNNSIELQKFQEKFFTDSKDAFKSISYDALEHNQQQFFNLAKQKLDNNQNLTKSENEKTKIEIKNMVEPFSKSVKDLDNKLENMQKDYSSTSSALKEQFHTIISQTNKLNSVLSNPQTRGQWGEFQLEKMLENAGMRKNIDYNTQVHRSNENGAIRPDAVINLTEEKKIILDSKVALDALFDAYEAKDLDTKKLCMEKHIKDTREHINKLSSKEYTKQFQRTPEMVVMYIPNDAIMINTISEDPNLFEYAYKKGVVMASPQNLLVLLKTVAVSWREESLSKDAEKISKLGRELSSRMSKFVQNFTLIGSRIESAQRAFNDAVRRFDGSVIPTMKKFEDLKITEESDKFDVMEIDVSKKNIEKLEFFRNKDVISNEEQGKLIE